jgi:hypothetical protein
MVLLWTWRRWAPTVALGALLVVVLFSPRAWWAVTVPISYAGLLAWLAYNGIRYWRGCPSIDTLLELDQADDDSADYPDLFGSMDHGAEQVYRLGHVRQTAGPGAVPSLTTAPGPASNGKARHRRPR